MGTVLPAVSAAVIASVIVAGLVRAGTRESRAEQARLAEEARVQASATGKSDSTTAPD
jgi:restriction system protein